MSIAFLWWAVLGLTTGLAAYAAPLLVRTIGAALAAIALRSVGIARPRTLAIGLILAGLFDLIGFPFNASGLAPLGIVAEFLEAVASVWFIVFAVRSWNAVVVLEIGPLRWPLSLIRVNAIYWTFQLTARDAPYVPGNITYRARVEGEATRDELLDLMRHTDSVAEVQNTLRKSVPVVFTD